jgi:predicted ATP-dependent endonuclease of OLD family
VHLLFIEEPEAHLQQAFIRKVMELLRLMTEIEHVIRINLLLLLVRHIFYERGFQPIRYFQRSRAEKAAFFEVLNVSAFTIVLNRMCEVS